MQAKTTPHEFTRKIAVEAGAILMSHYRRLAPEAIVHKGEIDLVTTADLESERYIAARIRETFPGHTILSEEEVAEEAGEHHWIVDPLDGTTNFAHSLPLFAVSVAYQHRGETTCGAVYIPRLDELFHAGAGEGAFLNGEPIQVSRRSALRECVIGTGFHYERRTLADNNVDAFGRFILDVQGIRRMGVAAIDLSYVACGRLDGFWEPHLSPHDVAAGALIVSEAGGRVTDYEGGSDFMGQRRIVASNGAIHDAMLSRLEVL